jgi:serum response factor
MTSAGLQAHHQLGSKRGSDMSDMMGGNGSSDEDGSMDIKPSLSERSGTGRGAPLKSGSEGPPTGKKTKGRVKIKMEFIDNKLRRYTTFSKRKTGIMKKVKLNQSFYFLSDFEEK